MHRAGVFPATHFGELWGPQEKSQNCNKPGKLKTSWGFVNPQSFKVSNLTYKSKQFIEFLKFPDV